MIKIIPDKCIINKPYLILQIHPNIIIALHNCKINANILTKNDFIFESYLCLAPQNTENEAINVPDFNNNSSHNY